MVCYTSRPFAMGHSEAAHKMRSPLENQKHYCQHAHWSFMSTLKDVLASCSDLSDLERCGLVIDTTAGKVRGLTLDSGLVAIQSSYYQTFCKLTKNLVASHAIALSRHPFGAPYCLAALLHEDPGKVAKSAAWLKRVYDAIEVALQSPQPAVAVAAARSPFRSAMMRVAFAFLAAGQWARVTSQLQQLLVGLFRGLGQTKVAEDL